MMSSGITTASRAARRMMATPTRRFVSRHGSAPAVYRQCFAKRLGLALPMHERFRARLLWLTPVVLLAAACQTNPVPSAPPAGSTVESPVSADAPAPVPSDIPAGTPIDEMPLPEGEFSFTGGDGTSLEQAVIVNAPNERIGVAASYGWIGRRYPGSTAQGQNTVIKNGRFYDAIDIVTANKERRTFYFDITQFFGKF